MMEFYKKRSKDTIYWIDREDDYDGIMEFTFDKKKIYNLFADYPHNLTAEEKTIFDKENPFWADFFKNRVS